MQPDHNTGENKESPRSFLMHDEFAPFMTGAFTDTQRKELHARGYTGSDKKIYRTLLREKRNWDQIGAMIEADSISLKMTFNLVADIIVEPFRRIGDRFTASRKMRVRKTSG